MAMQEQKNASIAARLGARLSAANAEHKDKPVDLGNRRLPPGIKNGIAKLSAMYTKEQTEENGMVPKGETFFRASAVVMSPKVHDGEKVEGALTTQLIPLCDMPAKGNRKAKAFTEHWYDFQNIFKLLGIPPCPETPATDPDGKKTEAYFFSAMKALTNPQKPVYISFSTRGWTPPANPQQPKPEEMVFETWHGVADLKEAFNPAAGMSAAPPVTAPPPPPTQSLPPTTSGGMDLADEVASLVEVATNDPEGATTEGEQAAQRLETLAWAAGWTQEQTKAAADWAAIGDMALTGPVPPPPVVPPTSPIPPTQPSANGVAVGSRYLFAKRTKDGAKLKNNKGEEFPPQEVEVVTVNPVTKTCTVKSRKDGKDVVDIRTKAPVEVKWEWLEAAPAY